MRKYLVLLLMFACVNIYGQVRPRYIVPLVQAGVYLRKNSVKYNPEKAFEIYKQYANMGNARAMNSLAILYSEGTGASINQHEALNWFEKSAEKGFPQAFHNLGNMYRMGWGVEQNFETAYYWFRKGTSKNYSPCMYYQGYMLFKGLGVVQNYEKAITLFRMGIKNGSIGSMYMIGLCFRNGYGIEKNTDSARYWLWMAASRGYRFAKEELQVPEEENISEQLLSKTKNSSNDHNKASVISGEMTEIYPTFKRVEQASETSNITGEYTGFVTRYDFSGKHVIGLSSLRLKLDTEGDAINGSWTEGDYPTVKLHAEMTDSGLVFNNSAYLAPDHYSVGQPINYLFKNARLLVVRQKDSIYLAGNLQLWSVTRNEPEKPVYISLTRNVPVIGKLLSSLDTIKLKVPVVSELKVYPNPYINSFQVSFTLNQQSQVEISLTDLMGRIVYLENPKVMIKGHYNLLIQPNLQKGAYLFILKCNGHIKSTIIIQQ